MGWSPTIQFLYMEKFSVPNFATSLVLHQFPSMLLQKLISSHSLNLRVMISDIIISVILYAHCCGEGEFGYCLVWRSVM